MNTEIKPKSTVRKLVDWGVAKGFIRYPAGLDPEKVLENLKIEEAARTADYYERRKRHAENVARGIRQLSGEKPKTLADY